MEAKKILQSDILDILFENRNKEYGAYALRRQYGSHMNMAMLLTFGFGLIAALSSFFHKPEASTPTGHPGRGVQDPGPDQRREH
jgi:protein TonB